MHPWLSPIFEGLVERLKRAKLHHGLLVYGASGVGKTPFSHLISQRILCNTVPGQWEPCGHCQSCQLFVSGSHPDYYTVESDKQIGVDQIREVITKLSSTSQLSGNKVLVIRDADRMTESAANALLKTLEEPTKNTYLILVTAKVQKIMPTILSRCEKVMVKSPNKAEVIRWLNATALPDNFDELFSLFADSPLLLKAHLDNPQDNTFDVIAKGIDGLLNHQITTLQLAEKSQEHAEQMIAWLLQSVRQNIGNHYQSTAYWQCFSMLKDANIAITNPAFNKVLVLNNVLAEYHHLHKSR